MITSKTDYPLSRNGLISLSGSTKKNLHICGAQSAANKKNEKKSGKRAWIIKKNLHICGAQRFKYIPKDSEFCPIAPHPGIFYACMQTVYNTAASAPVHAL